jgi:HK97 family phage major capsid protein
MLPANMPVKGPHQIGRSFRGQAGRMQRDALASDFATAGALIAPEYRFPSIELLYNYMALSKAGITMISGVMGSPIVMPRMTSGTTSQSLPEGAILAEYDQTFDQVKFEPHRLGSKQLWSRLAMLQTGEDFEALVINDHMRINALRFDYLLLNGQGAGDEPLGLMNQPGIGVVTFGGSASSAYKNCVALETAIRKANIDEPPTFITTSVVRGTLRVTPATLTGSTVVSGSTNAIWSQDEIIERPATDSQQVPNDALVCLVGRHVVGMQWGGWQTVIDTLTFADADKIRLSMNTYVDGNLRHPQAVSRSADALTTLS